MRLTKPNFTREDLSVFDASRGLLALLVVVAHINQAIWTPVYGFGAAATIFGTIANISVVIFFFLSGMLITYSGINLTTRNGFNYKQFLLNRLTRIYPTLIFSLILVYILMRLFPLLNGNSYDIRKFPGELYSVREKYYVDGYQIVKTATLLITDIININGPMWSLFIEWWLYVSAMFLFITIENKRLWIRVISFILALLPLLYIFRQFQIPGLFYMAIWFLGAAFTLVINSSKTLKVGLLITSTATVLMLVLIKGPGVLNIAEANPLDFGFVQILFVVMYLNFFASLKFLRRFKSFAPFSYTLYLIHFPIILFVYAVLKVYTKDNVLYLGLETIGLFIVVIYFSSMVAKVTEDKKLFRKFISKLR